jgi:hypothetical protein
MDKARDSHRESREVPNERDEMPRPHGPERGKSSIWSENDDTADDIAEESSESVGREFSGPFYFAVRGGNAWRGDPYFDSVLDAEALWGFRDNNIEGFLFGGIKGAEANPASKIAESIDEGVLFFRGGVELRYYPFPTQPVFSPYILGQVGGFYMIWSFKNPLEAGNETISNDTVGGLMLAAGIGVNLINVGRFRLGASCVPEIMLFSPETEAGFQNDVFGYYGAVRWVVEAGVSFK